MADPTPAHYSDHEEHFRTHYRDTYGEGESRVYGDYEPAYRSGFRYGTAPEHKGRAFGDLEPDMRRRYETEHGEGSWRNVRSAAQHAFRRGRRALEREQPGEEKAGTSGPSGSDHSVSGDPGSIMREGDSEVFDEEDGR